MQRAEAQVALEKKRAMNEIKDDVSDMAVDIASAVLQRDIRSEEHTELIDSFIENWGTAMIDAASYGRALFQLAEEDGCGDGVLEELQLVRRALRENPGYVTLMDTPAVAGAGKTRPAAAGFSGASQELRNFLCLLCDPARALAAARLPDRL